MFSILLLLLLPLLLLLLAFSSPSPSPPSQARAFPSFAPQVELLLRHAPEAEPPWSQVRDACAATLDECPTARKIEGAETEEEDDDEGEDGEGELRW
eukprot:6013259-Pyramimonas_sp.AAC.1